MEYSRRHFLRLSGLAGLAGSSAPFLSAVLAPGVGKGRDAVRCLNVVNFIRGVEPRFETDLLLPVRKQMECLKEHGLPVTWLLQFDALVSGGFTAYLKENIAANHEVGFWFEMNEMHCREAGVVWRGRPGYEWDHLPPVAFTIGYTPDERILLADAAMRRFHAIWGRYPSSVASWNLDAITIAHLVDRYHVDAFAVCRDQVATDGFTIWGAPIAGYYPSTVNCWSPAVRSANQIHAPVFRMLGQDPVHYYQTHYKTPDGRSLSEPDTMEPVWFAGKSPTFVRNFLDMIARGPTMAFAYAQLGQENSFPWSEMAEAYPKQMAALAAVRDAGGVHVETTGESGRRFKRAFRTTPVQAQVMLEDSFGNTSPAESSIWYQSRFYRANLHVRDGLPFLRDLTVYSDENPQPYLDQATRLNDVEQRMPAVLDGFHWGKTVNGEGEIGAGGFLEVDGERLRLARPPSVTEKGTTLVTRLPLLNGDTVQVDFEEDRIALQLLSASPKRLRLVFAWDPGKAAFRSLAGKVAHYAWGACKYAVVVKAGEPSPTPDGWQVESHQGVVTLGLGQGR